ncbi:MAG TPA: class I SAM-dependent methyltransferase [Acidobacteriaceae bacterium]|nr:class I SAM-dependent methyltransferase [Acidobacteriaceae bacterium]
MSRPARFGRLAHIYRWMEYFSFGLYLQRCRMLRIAEFPACRRALVYGDGDGRFLAELVRSAREMRIVAVDASSEMLRQAMKRRPSEARLVQADALACEVSAFPEAPFDLIVSHFFLDCFDEEELSTLLARVNAAVGEDAVWVVSDFAIPPQPVARQLGRLVVGGLYLAFGLLTGLRTRRLPDHGRVMRECGWRLEDRRTLLLGLLASERWRRLLSHE